MSAKLRDAARADDLFRILEKYAPQLAGSLMEAWRDGVLHVVLDDLADLISKGRIDEALTLVMWGADRVFAAKAAAPLQEAFTAVAAHVWTRDLPPMPKVSRIRVVFDALNPNTVDAAKRNQLEMVQEVTTETRDGLKAYIEDALKRGTGLQADRPEHQSRVGLRPDVRTGDRRAELPCLPERHSQHEGRQADGSRPQTLA